MAILAYEGFINFLGNLLLPEIWKDEKNKFKGKTIENKIEKMISEKGIDFDPTVANHKNPGEIPQFHSSFKSPHKLL